MKTNWIALKQGSLLPLVMAAIFTLTTIGCEKVSPLSTEDRPEINNSYSSSIMSQSFTVYPEGTEVNVLDGVAKLTFPEGTVMVPTEFTITCFPIHHLDLDGINTFNRGLSLESGTPDQKLVNVMVQLNYDLLPDNWLKNTPVVNSEKSLTIYHVSPVLYAYERIYSIGDCCVDISCNMIRGCISCCGFYVVGEN